MNATGGTDAFGGNDTNDNFFAARVGGSLNYELDGGLLARRHVWTTAIRDYDDKYDRRNDSDLRWNGAVRPHASARPTWALGLRGRVSYRGNSDYRNDFGIYGDYRLRLDADNQIGAGA